MRPSSSFGIAAASMRTSVKRRDRSGGECLKPLVRVRSSCARRVDRHGLTDEVSARRIECVKSDCRGGTLEQRERALLADASAGGGVQRKREHRRHAAQRRPQTRRLATGFLLGSRNSMSNATIFAPAALRLSRSFAYAARGSGKPVLRSVASSIATIASCGFGVPSYAGSPKPKRGAASSAATCSAKSAMRLAAGSVVERQRDEQRAGDAGERRPAAA